MKDWQNKKVKSQEEVLHFKWYRKTSLPEIVAPVDVGKIVGTDYPEYAEGTWLQMLKNLKPRRTGETFPSERYFEMVRNEYDHSAGKQPITVSKYGEEYILCQSGNHRICHAKFAGIQFLRLRVQEYTMDPALIAADFASRRAVMDATEAVKEPNLWQQVLKRLGFLFAQLDKAVCLSVRRDILVRLSASW